MPISWSVWSFGPLHSDTPHCLHFCCEFRSHSFVASLIIELIRFAFIIEIFTDNTHTYFSNAKKLSSLNICTHAPFTAPLSFVACHTLFNLHTQKNVSHIHNFRVVLVKISSEWPNHSMPYRFLYGSLLGDKWCAIRYDSNVHANVWDAYARHIFFCVCVEEKKRANKLSRSMRTEWGIWMLFLSIDIKAVKTPPFIKAHLIAYSSLFCGRKLITTATAKNTRIRRIKHKILQIIPKRQLGFAPLPRCELLLFRSFNFFVCSFVACINCVYWMVIEDVIEHPWLNLFLSYHVVCLCRCCFVFFCIKKNCSPFSVQSIFLLRSSSTVCDWPMFNTHISPKVNWKRFDVAFNCLIAYQRTKSVLELNRKMIHSNCQDDD